MAKPHKSKATAVVDRIMVVLRRSVMLQIWSLWVWWVIRISVSYIGDISNSLFTALKAQNDAVGQMSDQL